jgi:prepilin-type N-terminal cleavage/methylation domain-containing protein
VRRRGFTLIELILVMIVIFTLAAIVAPRFSDFFPSFQVRKTSERLLGWARKARADAATTGIRHRLVVDPTQKKYWIEYEARPMKEPGIFTLLGGAWGEELLPDAVSFESIDSTGIDPSNAALRFVEFRPDGTATEATIVVSNENGDRQSLKIEAETAKIALSAAGEAGK